MHIDGVPRLPTRLLSFTSADGELVPAWFGDRDRPWLRDLLEDTYAMAGLSFATWHRRWAGSDPDPRAGGTRQRIALHVLGGWLRRRSRTAPLSAVRRTLFELGATTATREQALAEAAARHQTTPDALAQELYRDLPDQRPLKWPSLPPDPGDFAAAINLAVVRGMVHHCQQLTATIRGGSRALLRTTWLLGMQVAIAPRTSQSPEDAMQITWHRSNARQRGPSSLVAMLPWTMRYRLRGRCTIGDTRGELVLATGDPIQPGPEPRRYDSALERNFAQRFLQLLPDWQLLREPRAVTTPSGLAFPDFSLRPPGGETWLCELAGLRDPSALAAKRSLLHACPRLILCVPRTVMTDELRSDPRVVPFARRVDPRAVAAAVLGNRVRPY